MIIVVWKKTGKYYTYKKPIYKTKNVKSKKWVYKHVLTEEDYWDDEWNDLTVYDYPENENYYWNHGYKWYGSYYKTYDDGHHVEYYSKFKKKVPFVKKKKVKTGKYKKVKVPIYMVISKNFQNGWGYCIDVKTKK